jgi:hypothetical protein
MKNTSSLTTAVAAIGVISLLVYRKLAKTRQHDHSFVPTPGIASRQDRFKILNVAPGEPLKVPMAEYFLSQDGLYIHFRRWVPLANIHPLPPRGICVIVHGMGEYCARYESVARALNAAGFIVYALDHQGHGRSEGDRLHVKKFEDYIEDVMLVVKLAKRENPLIASKTFMIAHSMGGT